MAIPQAFIEEVKARAGLVEIVGRRVKLVRRGREHHGLCPFHNEKTPSFTVNEAKGFYHCFGCGAHGSAIDFVMQTEGLSFPEAVERLAGEAGMEVPRARPDEAQQERRRQDLQAVTEAAAEWFQAQLMGLGGAGARDYLKRRGLDRAAAGRFRLGFAPDSRDALKTALLARGFAARQLEETGLVVTPEDGGDSYDRFRNRLIFPIADRRGRVVAFGGRALGEQRAKYLNSPETPIFHKGRLLYNLAQAREPARAAGAAVLVEGYMDVIALDQAGLGQAVAPLGTALTEDQLRELWRLAPEPVICFDGDEAGRRAARRAAERALPLLRPGHSLGFVELPAGEDPDSLVRGRGLPALEAMLAAAEPLSGFLWLLHTQGRSLDTPERRAGLRQELRELVRQIQDPTVRAYYGAAFKQLLERAFGPLHPDDRAGPGRRPRGPAGPSGGRLSRRYGLAAAETQVERRERVLISMLINYPELIHRVFEEVARLHLSSVTLDKIRLAILEQAPSGAPLDLAALKSQFSDSGMERLLAELTGPGTAELDPAARPERPLAQVTKDWTSVFRLHRLNDLRRDLQAAEAELARDMTDGNLARLTALQEALARAEADAADDDDEGQS